MMLAFMDDGADGGTRTHTPFRKADFLTTSVCTAAPQIAVRVRGLDCPFTVDDAWANP
jgi:hypothetical protein